MKKKIIKFVVVAIIILGFYYGSQVTPVEEKRADATLENFRSIEAVSFEMEGSMESVRDGFYDLSISEGYMDKQAGEGSFILDTRLEGESQRLEGEFIYLEDDLFLNFDEDGLPIVLESFFRDNFGREIEEIRNNWIKTEVDFFFPDFQMVEGSVEVVSEDEDGDKYHYGFQLEAPDLIEESVYVEILTGREDLNLYEFTIDSEIELSRDISFSEPFESFSVGNSPTLELGAEFSDFDEVKEVNAPEEYLDI